MSPAALIRLLMSALVVLALAACGGGAAKRATTSTQRAAAAPTGPCVPAAIHRGAPPAWTAAAWSESSPGFRIPYALASGDAAAAFFFAPKLRAGDPSNPSNKILWVVRFPRDGNPLEITARPGRDPAKAVRISFPADSSPGEIYPSYINLPTPGCWRLALAWGSHRASISVRVVRRL